jgi:luciferase family oxidoreductase group 1
MSRRSRRPLALSILDLATIGEEQTAAEGFKASVAVAQHAEAGGYKRVWYAEHHNMASIASSAPAVLIAHIAAHTTRIRLGAGGVMLPNHPPLVVAEQFGTLATLNPDRIDLGLGRAAGGDPATWSALRRDPRSGESFPQDVLELQGYLRGESLVKGVEAVPRADSIVPLYILGSSLFGARVAAALGLPYAFASHFAPTALKTAISLYRKEFRPSKQIEEPYVLASVNVFAAEREIQAHQNFEEALRTRSAFLLTGRRVVSDEEYGRLAASPHGQQIAGMLAYSAVGTPRQVQHYLSAFARATDADELIIVPASLHSECRLDSVDLVAESLGDDSPDHA